MILGIIGAMKVEMETLCERLQGKSVRQIAGMDFYKGTLCGVQAIVVQSGVGKVNAAICTQILCDRFHVTHIINTGVAGSLCAELDICDFVISDDLIYHDVDCHLINVNYPVGQVPGMSTRTFSADAQLRNLAMQAVRDNGKGKGRIGRIASGDQFVCSKEAKEKIIADTGAVCTEMEGAAIAHTAWKNGVAFVIIRAICDKADDSAVMDSPTFEKTAAIASAEVTIRLVTLLSEA